MHVRVLGIGRRYSGGGSRLHGVWRAVQKYGRKLRCSQGSSQGSSYNGAVY